MSNFTLLRIALIAPVVFGLPMPQYGWPGQGSFAVGTATMGGLSSSITTGDGGSSYAGPSRPNYNNGGGRGSNDNNWPSVGNSYDQNNNNNNGGGGREWKGNGGTDNNRPSDSNSYNNPNQGGEISTIVTTSGRGGTTSSSRPYKKTKRHEPKSQQPQGYGSWFSGLFENYGYGKPSNIPVGTATIGGLTSSITLGDHKKRQVGVAAMGGLESSITLQESIPGSEDKPAYDESPSYEGHY